MTSVAAEELKETDDATHNIDQLDKMDSTTEPLTSGTTSNMAGFNNEIAPEPRSFIEDMEKHLDCLLELAKQIPPKRWDEPETEGTVFRRFVGALRMNVRHLKDDKWILAGYEVLPRSKQMEKFAEVFHVGRVYEEFFGGGSAMSDVALQEFANLRAKALDTEQTLRRLYEHVQRPQPGRPLQQLVNFGVPGRGAAPRVFGANAGQYYREQGDLQFLNHPIRESEDFAVVRHSDAYTLLCEADWDLPGNIAASEEGGSGEEPKEGREEGAPPDAPGGALDVQFTDVAHQFKTLCFGYQLLQVSGLQLNVYNSFYYIPHEKGGKRWLLIMACFLIQLLSPILLLVQQVEFLEELWSGGRAKAQGPWMSISVFCVIILFNIINQEIFAKQVRNSLVVRRLRNVVWNSTGSWQSALITLMDIYANVVNPCITAVVINIVLFSSADVLDAILNALALNFITEVDEYVVRSDLDDAQLQHAQELDKKIVEFIAGNKRMACTYALSEEAREDQAARKVIITDIQKTAQIVTPCLTLAFAGSFIALLVLSCM